MHVDAKIVPGGDGGWEETGVRPPLLKTCSDPYFHRRRRRRRHPVGHMGEISDIAQAVVYLDSAKFVTGKILHADGEQSAGH